MKKKYIVYCLFFLRAHAVAPHTSSSSYPFFFEPHERVLYDLASMYPILYAQVLS